MYSCIHIFVFFMIVIYIYIYIYIIHYLTRSYNMHKIPKGEGMPVLILAEVQGLRRICQRKCSTKLQAKQVVTPKGNTKTMIILRP